MALQRPVPRRAGVRLVSPGRTSYRAGHPGYRDLPPTALTAAVSNVFSLKSPGAWRCVWLAGTGRPVSTASQARGRGDILVGKLGRRRGTGVRTEGLAPENRAHPSPHPAPSSRGAVAVGPRRPGPERWGSKLDPMDTFELSSESDGQATGF